MFLCLAGSMALCCPVNVTVDFDSTVTFSCCDRAWNNSWFKLLFQVSSTDPIQTLYSGSAIHQSHAARLTVDFERTSTLPPVFHLANVKVTDTGSYYCREFYNSTSRQAQATQLYVLCM